MGHVFERSIAGRRLTLDAGRLARQANGSVLVSYGETVVLVTATVAQEPREGIDFFPLTVDYEERLYAAGRIPGSFFRREGRPSERAILTGRLIDRSVRPLFPKGLRNDVQVVVTVLSVDLDSSPEFCGLVGASAALTLSDIPFDGPLAAVVVGRVEGEFILNPTLAQSVRSDLHLVIAGTDQAVVMVEAGAGEVEEQVMLDAVAFARPHLGDLVGLQQEAAAAIGKPKRCYAERAIDLELQRRVDGESRAAIGGALRDADKLRREESVRRVFAEAAERLRAEFPARESEIRSHLDAIMRDEVRSLLLTERLRLDGRAPDEIRSIESAVGVLPRVHGSGLFTRGQTQVLTVATLGTIGDVQTLDNLSAEDSKRYMHHYNFPPYSVGEARPLRGPGRRDIGHGALAERALQPVLPDQSEFPYTIRLVSEVLESNGSTSMASVCGSSLALMDAGVPIRGPVGGVAMGLVMQDDQVVILSDIQGIEDALGDMDFKVAGTRRGITALQLDVKTKGIAPEVLGQALEQARRGRLHILDRMVQAIAEPRKHLSPWAPRIITVQIDPEKIREVIGPGGKVINKIIAETGAKIDIEDDGRIFIASVDQEGGERAVRMIQQLTREVRPGEVYVGRVSRIMNFGAFVEVLPGKEGLVHISELADERVNRVEDVVQVGDQVLVKVTEIDRLGRINLSRKAALREDRGSAPAAKPT
ncbi:MAG TPA: polyribonucleotide nucleotidyltransferase [Bacillota bacterium]|nr:polyribonucleotide nucleotidyltransferase [Bacillota bacterium]